MGWFNQLLNFINSAVKPFFHCQHLMFWSNACQNKNGVIHDEKRHLKECG